MLSCSWNETDITYLLRIDWRASLVPAAAVTPAPIAYVKVAVVKLLGIVFLLGPVGPPVGCAFIGSCIRLDTATNFHVYFMCLYRLL
jgi:hypothetical protein